MQIQTTGTQKNLELKPPSLLTTYKLGSVELRLITSCSLTGTHYPAICRVKAQHWFLEQDHRLATHTRTGSRKRKLAASLLSLMSILA